MKDCMHSLAKKGSRTHSREREGEREKTDLIAGVQLRRSSMELFQGIAQRALTHLQLRLTKGERLTRMDQLSLQRTLLDCAAVVACQPLPLKLEFKVGAADIGLLERDGDGLNLALVL